MTIASRSAIDGSMLRIRAVAFAVAVVLACRTATQEGWQPALTLDALAACVGLTAWLEWRVVLRSSVRMSGAIVIVDLVTVGAALAINGARPGDPMSLLVALPLIEAGVRHGAGGLVATWLASSAGIVVWESLAIHDPRSDVAGAAQLVAVSLMVSLPATQLSQHLAQRVDRFDAARRHADRRSRVLAEVLHASRELVSTDPDSVLAGLQHAVASVAGGHCYVTEMSSLAPEERREVLAADGEIVLQSQTSIALVWLGREISSVLVVEAEGLDPLVVEAIEVLAANGRVAHRIAVLHATVAEAASHWADRARIDSLTGLLNRGGLMEAVAALIDTCGHVSVAVAFVDLDRFKQVNDTYGHDVGDELIQVAAERLRAASPSAVCGRLGGDEFLLAGVVSSDIAAEQLEVALARAVSGTVVTSSGVELQLELSVGVTIRSPGAITDVAALLSSADEAMYRVKQRRRAARPTAEPVAV